MALGRRASLRDPIASTCEKLDISPAQIHALMWLGLDGALPMGELARRLSSTEKTVTGLVDRLERQELAKRTRDARDRRVVHVALTRRGANVHKKIQTQMKARLNLFLAMLDRAERQSFVRILERLVERLSPHTPVDSHTKETP